jgi:hypothetical protein
VKIANRSGAKPRPEAVITVISLFITGFLWIVVLLALPMGMGDNGHDFFSAFTGNFPGSPGS